MAASLILVHFWILPWQTFWFLVEAEVVQEVGLSSISAEAVMLRPVVWEVLELFRREKVLREFQGGWFSWQVEYS